MNILLTGATGYIAQRLLPVLLENRHDVICCVRDRARFDTEKFRSTHLSVFEVDFLKPDTLKKIPSDIDSAYYLIHSMSTWIYLQGNDKKYCWLTNKTLKTVFRPTSFIGI